MMDDGGRCGGRVGAARAPRPWGAGPGGTLPPPLLALLLLLLLLRLLRGTTPAVRRGWQRRSASRYGLRHCGPAAVM